MSEINENVSEKVPVVKICSGSVIPSKHFLKCLKRYKISAQAEICDDEKDPYTIIYADTQSDANRIVFYAKSILQYYKESSTHGVSCDVEIKLLDNEKKLLPMGAMVVGDIQNFEIVPKDKKEFLLWKLNNAVSAYDYKVDIRQKTNSEDYRMYMFTQFGEHDRGIQERVLNRLCKIVAKENLTLIMTDIQGKSTGQKFEDKRSKDIELPRFR